MIQQWGHLSRLDTAELSCWTMCRLSSAGGGGSGMTTGIIQTRALIACMASRPPPGTAHMSYVCNPESNERGFWGTWFEADIPNKM